MLKNDNLASSSENEELILVDQNDNDIGFLSKSACHAGEGVLHRAFSVILFNINGELLLQKRSALKKLWPMYWSNSCCSHPRSGEIIEDAVQRRLKEELGVCLPLEFIYKFSYQANYENLGSENELCSVYLGRIDKKITINTEEIADYKYINHEVLTQDMKFSPEQYTPWFKMEWERLLADFRGRLEIYF